ncbi:MAG: class I mannose-6-phosphate isomerase [Terriglobia bacterium]|jgi:mannose-6-phosphate isomerase class I
MAASKYQRGLYQTRPVVPIEPGRVLESESIDERLLAAAAGGALLVDGFLGVDWNQVKRHLQSLSIFADSEFFDMRSAMLSEHCLDALIAPCLDNGDPVFGRMCEGSLADFFLPGALRTLQARVAKGNCVVLGPGAALTHEKRPVVYFDVSKESLQVRSQKPLNLGQRVPVDGSFYKRAYFVDWPVLERHRNSIRSRISLWIDANHQGRWLALEGPYLRSTISGVARRPFRVKPWFLPGPWGGQFMKGHMGLNSGAPNLAWSYELIAPENGVLVGRDSMAVELPVPFLIAQEPDAYLGEAVARRFGSNFPIRFDYLDTVNGGNLSLQCHPSDSFIHSQFGEPFTQDETYYIHDCQGGSTVYLGFREDANLEEFWEMARRSETEGRPFEVERFINVWPSQKHDMFLIPNGTVHCSGRGNLVLEISATPYIYTFKIYDYVRQDLAGNLRPLHIDYARLNARPDRTTGWVKSNLIPLPRLTRREADWEVYEICNTPLLFYAVERVEFSTRVRGMTSAGVEVVNLVEGEQVEIISLGGSLELHYAETAIIPAAAGAYVLQNRSRNRAKLLKAMVRPL